MERSSKAVTKSESNAQQTYEYHAHDKQEVLDILGAKEIGLTAEEAKKRQEKHGPNAFKKEKGRGLLVRIFAQLSSPLTFVLVIAFGITFVLGEYVDAGVIAAALAIAVLVGVLQEGKASRAFSKLSDSQADYATVIRDGLKHQVLAKELTIGDIVVLQSGMQVPADLRLLRAKQLSINEATLTGEWLAVDKHTDPVKVGIPLAEQTSMAWMGTFVAEGYGLGVVTAIGEGTAVGKLAQDVRDVEESDTPLQEEMQRVSKLMLYLIVVLVILIFMIGLFQGQTLHDMLIISIAIAVASIPEGLPAAVTIILAVGMEALLRRGGLVRNLLAAETLGSTTYVLTDKTGTLTRAEMAIVGVVNGSGKYVPDTEFEKSQMMKDVFVYSLVAVDAYTDYSEKTSVVRGDAVEKAILTQAGEIGVTEDNTECRKNRIDYLAFTSEQRFAAGLCKWNEEHHMLCVNGAPGFLLEKAGHVLTEEGEISANESEKDRLREMITEQTSSGKRLVAVGYKRVNYDDIPEFAEDLLDDMVFAGVMVLDDPVREGVKEAIEGVKAAGAEVILITGDNAETALSIAKEVGIADTGDTVITGDKLESMSDQEIITAIDNVSVFARVLPKQKMRIAGLLQQRGEIVAMTGDGINDAPALRRANIGIAIGSGTEVAKEASDLVLVKDSFATIYSAIEEGRRIIANLRKIVGYLVSTSLSEVVLIGAALMTGGAAPILPSQILWANVIEEGLMSVAFAFEKGDKNAMKQKPQDIHDEGILSRDMMWFITYVVTVLSMLTVGLYFFLRIQGSPIEELRSVMFLAISVDSLFLSFAFRSLTVPVWKVPIKNNLFFFGSFVISFGLLLLVLTVPFFQYLLSYQPLTFVEMMLVVVFGFTSLMVIELGKWLYFERKVDEA